MRRGVVVRLRPLPVSTLLFACSCGLVLDLPEGSDPVTDTSGGTAGMAGALEQGSRGGEQTTGGRETGGAESMGGAPLGGAIDPGPSGGVATGGVGTGGAATGGVPDVATGGAPELPICEDSCNCNSECVCVGNCDCKTPCDCDGDGEKSEECGGEDCDDEDPRVYPGQTAFFSVRSENRDVGFDYDCSGNLESPEEQDSLACGALLVCGGDQGFLDGLPRCGETGRWGKCVNQGLGCGESTIDSSVVLRCH